MKFRITPKAADTEVVLTLQKASDGSINVMGSVAGGTEFYLMKFKSDGTVRMTACIPAHLGFQLDRNERIVVEGRE